VYWPVIASNTSASHIAIRPDIFHFLFIIA